MFIFILSGEYYELPGKILLNTLTIRNIAFDANMYFYNKFALNKTTPSSSSLNVLKPYAKRNLYAGQFIFVDHNNYQLPNHI